MPDEQPEGGQTTEMSAVEAAIATERSKGNEGWPPEPPETPPELEGAPAAEQETPPEGQLDGQPEAEAQPEGEKPEEQKPEETAEGEQPPAKEAGGEEESEPMVVSLPGRQPEDPDVEIEVSDPDVAERLRQLRNGYMRKSQLDRQRHDLDGQRRELQQVDMLLTADPVTFVLDRVSPDIQKELALQLLSDDGVYEHVVEQMSEWEQSPDKKEAARANLRVKRLERQGEVKDTLGQQERLDDQAQQLDETIGRLIPDEMDEYRATMFLGDARRDLLAYFRDHKIEAPTEKQFVDLLGEIPGILSHRLRLYGIETSRPDGGGGSPPGQPATPVARPADEAAARLAEEAKATPNRVRAAVAKRRDVAGVAPAGAGMPTAPPAMKPPAGSGVKDAIKHARKHWVGGG